MRRVGAALPALALIGGGAALAATGAEQAPPLPVTQARPQVSVPSVPQNRPGAPVLPALPPVPSALAETRPAAFSLVSSPRDSPSGIPIRALEAYRHAAATVDAADPTCQIDWALVAAIGKVESNHGRYAGNAIDDSGTVRPGIYGLPLNGRNNTATIPDSDGGLLDRDTQWDRAVGPMQFIPTTWDTVGVDADGNGTKDPQSISDAATATAVYLCSGPGDLTQPTDLRSAVLRYNRSDAYVRQVVSIADAYRRGVTVLAATALTSAQTAAPPYLPSHELERPPAGAGASTPAPSATSSRPASSRGSTGGGGASGTSGTDGTSGGSGSSPEPGPSPAPTRAGAVDTLTDTVSSASSPTPTSTSTPAPEPTSTILGVVRVGELCP
jgi:hypothetical protein